MTHLFLALALSLQAETADLNHSNPEVRKAACAVLGGKGVKSAIPALIDLLKREDNDSVKVAAVEALERLTEVKGHGPDYAKWKSWWDEVGSKNVHISGASSDEIRTVAESVVNPMLKEVHDKADAAKGAIQMLTIAGTVIGTFFVLIMIYFVGHVSSKLKEWKELVKQAEVYVKESEQITKRTDRVLDELEAKKTEILEFVKKLKEEKETEIERYADLLQQNTEHRMREEVMGLRQKAERELEATLSQLRQQIDMEVRRLGGDQKDMLDRDFKAQHERFLREVEAHTLFLQANFAHSHGKPEEALKVYKKLLLLKTDHRVAWERMGVAYYDLMRYDEALEAYQKALELAPNDPACLYNMAKTYARRRERERMLETLEQAVQNDGEFKDEALNDPAFREYWNDPAFKDLAEA